MKKIFIILIISIYLFSTNVSYGNEEIKNSKVEGVYNTFITKVEKKYNLEKEIKLLNDLNDILNKAMKSSKLAANKKAIISDFLILNVKKLKSLEIKFSYISKARELEILKKFEKNNENNFKIEYEKNNDYSINNYNITSKFSNKAYNKDKLYLENGIWYYYLINNYKFFENPEKIGISDLDYNGINVDKSVVFLTDKNTLGFSQDYKKIKLISDDIIYGIPDKYSVLKEIIDDKRFLYADTDTLFKNLKKETLELTSGLSDEEKIKVIYKYILERSNYTKNINLEDKKIFSGIELYKNRDGVCEGYTKLFMYMLNFAGIGNVENVRGYVIDAPDFPNIGHAWITIGDKHFDPTFDDPVGLIKTKTFDEYQYFSLPTDLFYTNRFKYADTPDFIKTKSLTYRKEYIQNKLSNLSEKYEKENYVLLKSINYKKEHNIGINDKITISNFGNILPLYDVSNNYITINGKKKQIKKLFYYKIEDSTLESLLKQIKYDTTGHYFLKWDLGDGNYEYRLGYDLKF